MNLYILTVVAALASSAAWSQDQQQTQQPEPDAHAHAAPRAAAPFPGLQQQLQDMQSDWEKLSQTNDPAERQKILQTHREKMLQFAALLRAQADKTGAAGGCPMMMGHGDAPGPDGGAKMKGGGAMTPGHGDPMDRQQEMLAAFRQMEKRVDLLQSMVQRLLDAQNR